TTKGTKRSRFMSALSCLGKAESFPASRRLGAGNPSGFPPSPPAVCLLTPPAPTCFRECWKTLAHIAKARVKRRGSTRAGPRCPLELPRSGGSAVAVEVGEELAGVPASTRRTGPYHL